MATWCEQLTHWKRPWCWEILRTGWEGATENEMVGWHRWLDGHEFEPTLGDGEGQGSLVCCSPWGHGESETTEWLKNYKYYSYKFYYRWCYISFYYYWQAILTLNLESIKSQIVSTTKMLAPQIMLGWKSSLLSLVIL